jgi:hypothetical protein
MIRALLGLLLGLCCTTAWGQVPIYPALPQPPAISAYQQAFPQSYYQPQFYPGFQPYDYGPYGFGRYGFAARGVYPPNPFGNMNWLPPNPPSPYYVVPSGQQYLDQAQRRDWATYSGLMLRHNLQP